MTPGEDYIQKCRGLLDCIEAQMPAIAQAADWFSQSILAGRVVHVFGCGHSRIPVEELWPRYGSFAGFNPIVELSLTFHNQVVGANGQRQAMFLENVSGFAARILRNFDLSAQDSALVISSGGTNHVPVEMAEAFAKLGMKVVVVLGKQHSEASPSKRDDGKRMGDFADVVLDTGIPVGDAMVQVQGLDTPVSPGSSVATCAIINAVKAEVASRLTEAGQPPTVLTAANLVGAERSAEMFEAAYDQHAHRLAKLYETVGKSDAD